MSDSRNRRREGRRDERNIKTSERQQARRDDLDLEPPSPPPRPEAKRNSKPPSSSSSKPKSQKTSFPSQSAPSSSSASSFEAIINSLEDISIWPRESRASMVTDDNMYSQLVDSTWNLICMLNTNASKVFSHAEYRLVCYYLLMVRKAHVHVNEFGSTTGVPIWYSHVMNLFPKDVSIPEPIYAYLDCYGKVATDSGTVVTPKLHLPLAAEPGTWTQNVAAGAACTHLISPAFLTGDLHDQRNGNAANTWFAANIANSGHARRNHTPFPTPPQPIHANYAAVFNARYNAPVAAVPPAAAVPGDFEPTGLGDYTDQFMFCNGYQKVIAAYMTFMALFESKIKVKRGFPDHSVGNRAILVLSQKVGNTTEFFCSGKTEPSSVAIARLFQYQLLTSAPETYRNNAADANWQSNQADTDETRVLNHQASTQFNESAFISKFVASFKTGPSNT